MTGSTNDAYQQAGEWRARRARGLSPSEEARFRAWCSDAVNAEAYDRVARSWNAFEGVDNPALSAIRQRALRRRAPSRRLAFGQIAAGVAALVVAAGSYRVIAPRLSQSLGQSLGQNPDQTTYAADEGHVRDVTLDDGTQLTLDIGAVVTARMGQDRREITLVEGRTRFAVAHDPARPMQVDVGGGLVTVLGTTFNIDRRADAAIVTLIEGAVTISKKASRPGQAGSAVARLNPGEQVTIGVDGPGPVSSVDTAQASVWRDRKLEFVDVSLGEAIARVNRYADTPIAIDAPALAALRISGRFDHGDATGFADGIGKLYGLTSTRTDGRITLRRTDRPG